MYTTLGIWLILLPVQAGNMVGIRYVKYQHVALPVQVTPYMHAALRFYCLRRQVTGFVIYSYVPTCSTSCAGNAIHAPHLALDWISLPAQAGNMVCNVLIKYQHVALPVQVTPYMHAALRFYCLCRQVTWFIIYKYRYQHVALPVQVMHATLLFYCLCRQVTWFVV